MSYVVGEDENNDEYQEYVSEISTFEALMMQAILNQTTNIVASQNRAKKPTNEAALKQAEVLQSLAQTALMLTDAQWIQVTPAKLQGLVNRAVLENTLNNRTTKRNEPTTTDPESTTGSEEY